MAEIIKFSLAKLVEKQGPYGGLADGQSYYNGSTPDTSQTGAALVVDKNGWPVAMVKPKVLRTDPDGNLLDKVDVVDNGFKPESIKRHEPITRLSTLSTGSENEFRLIGVRVRKKMHEKVTDKARQNGGGYTTYEVSNDQIEANRPVVRQAHLEGIEMVTENHTKMVIGVVEEEGGRIIITSSRPNTDKELDVADDDYVRGMVQLLASRNYLNIDNPAILSWMQYTSHEMMENLGPQEIAERIRSELNYAEKGILEFDASAIHGHVRVNNSEPNPHFYAFVLNQEMGVLGPMLSVPTFSGPFRNGVYSKLHEAKQIHRPWFRTAGFQGAFYPMGSSEYLAEAYKNTTKGVSSSLTRAGITGDKSHGETRIRTEKSIKTMERLYGSAHPLPETEAAFVFSGVINTAILSHYYTSDGEGVIPPEAKKFFSKPNERRFNLNRQQIAVHGPFASIVNGEGKVQDYQSFISEYTKFVKHETKRLGITSSVYQLNGKEVNEVDVFTDRLNRVCEIPQQGWNLKNYMTEQHPDYAVGTLSTHLIAELAIKVLKDENWRTQYLDEKKNWQQATDYDSGKNWWKSILRNLPEGRYEEEIRDIIKSYSDYIHLRFQ
jgi:hypothetical protein